MIHLSLIYLCFTVLLALVDAIRIRVQWGLRQNINHDISYGLAAYCAILSIAFVQLPASSWWHPLLFLSIHPFVCALVRLSVYNPCLGIFRILTKTGRRVDYVSISTTSKTDGVKWWSKLGFWQQRAIALAGWGLIVWAYWKLTK